MSQQPPPYGQPYGQPAMPPYGPGQPASYPGPAPSVPPPGSLTGGAQGQLVINLRKPFGLLAEAMIAPAVSIDGFAAPVRWGHNAFPVPAGHRTVAAESRYLWPYGRQQMVVEVPPAQSVTIHYSGPMVSFGEGAMGYTEQPRPGRVVFGLLLALPLAILLFVFVAIIIGIATS